MNQTSDGTTRGDSMLIHRVVSEDVIGAAMKVQTALGPGC